MYKPSKWKKSTLLFLHKDEVLTQLENLVDPKYIPAVAEYVTEAYGFDRTVSIEILIDRLSAIDFHPELNVHVGSLLFFLSTEVPEV